MKRLITILATVLVLSSASAQTKVTSLLQSKDSVYKIVNDYLMGPNCELVYDDTLHWATFNYEKTVKCNSLGYFTNADTSGCNMPIDTGLVLATSSCVEKGTGMSPANDCPATSPRADTLVFYFTYYKVCMESQKPETKQKYGGVALEPKDLNDISSLEFWVRPKIDNFAFSYSFASDEYPNYVFSPYNDFFGIYFSGPYDSAGNRLPGTQHIMNNIATIPGTTDPVMINTVNHGKNHSSTDTTQMRYPQYHRINCLPKNNPYAAYTVRLNTRKVSVQAGAYFKVEIDIANVSDHALQSALYIAKDMRRFDTIVYVDSVCDNDNIDDLKKYYAEDGIEYEDIDAESDEDILVVRRYNYDNETMKLLSAYEDTLYFDYYIRKFSRIYVNTTGGDSIVTLYRIVKYSPYTGHNVTIRQGEYFDYNGLRFDKEGVVTDSLKTWYGCDSIVVYNVKYGDTNAIDTGVGIGPDVRGTESVRLYPNPASNFVRVEGVEGEALLMFFDMQGRKQREVLINGESDIDISFLKKGSYAVKIVNGRATYNKKLMVN